MSQDQLRAAAQAALDAYNVDVVTMKSQNVFAHAMADLGKALRAALREDALQRVSDIGQEMEASESCVWTRREGLVFDSSCGIKNILPMEAGLRRYCFRCGKRIKFLESEDEV